MKYFWKTKDNREINVDDLTPDHMRNIIKMIIRKHHKQEVSNCLVTLHGDIANMFNDAQDMFDSGPDWEDLHDDWGDKD